MEQVKEEIPIPDTDPKRQALKELLDRLDAEHGPIGKEEEEWASRELTRGVQGDLVLDAGALIALERGDWRARALVKRSESFGQIVVPASVLAQVWRQRKDIADAHVVCCALDSRAAIAT